MPDLIIPDIYQNINLDNYLINCYDSLTTIKLIHFIFIFIEIFLNIFQGVEIFIILYKSENIIKINTELNYISFLTNLFDKMPSILKLIIIILYIIIIEILYMLIKKQKYKIKYIYIKIIINILELFIFRTFMLIFFNFFCTLKKEYFIIGNVFLIPYIYLVINNFLYNHLYYFVPIFIEYPYDGFSSSFDIFLIITKLLLSMGEHADNINFGQFCNLILFLGQIFMSFYFLNKLINESYLFMKNTFLNKARLFLFFTETCIMIYTLLLEKTEILSILFLLICISIFIIIMVYIFFIYNPFLYIRINKDTPLENIFFYLHILSNRNDFEFIIKEIINNHYEKCGICHICKKYLKYINNHKLRKKEIDDEKENLIAAENEENNINNLNLINNNKLMDLFDVVYDGNNNYLYFIKIMVINYKNKGKEELYNNSYYFNYLSFLIYNDYKKNNITLSLNEKIILEIIKKENKQILENHEIKINQLLLCNKFICLSNQVLNLLKDILNSQPDISKAKKLIDLSFLLKKMRNPKYKKIFSHKLENISNSKDLIIYCSIVYEEIFNSALNKSQIYIKDNIQSLEDIIQNNNTNDIISLAFDLTRKHCKIIRVGKSLHANLNKNLFDLFPLIFKQYQINDFFSKLIENFKKDDSYISNISMNKKRENTKNLKNYLKQIKNKNKEEMIEIKTIICKNESSKIYYKLLTLKLKPLFNNDNNHYIIFDGIFFIEKNTIITLQYFGQDIKEKEKIIAISDPELEKENKTYSFSFKNYILWKNSQDFILTKIYKFFISEKIYNIYLVNKKKKNNKLEQKEITFKEKIHIDEEENEQTSNKKNNNLKNIQLIEENASTSSLQTSSSKNLISNLESKNKKKENLYEIRSLKKVRKAINIVILIIVFILTVEYLHLKILQKRIKNNNNNFLDYREFYKLYFQLFSSTLGITCIVENIKCKRLISIYLEKYYKDFNEEYFNFTTLVTIQNQILSKKIMEKRNVLLNIHRSIGNEKYNELFGKNIKYISINKKFNKSSVIFSLTPLNIKFYEAISMICNTYQTLSILSEDPIIFLNKTSDDPFSLLNERKNDNKTLTDYQKELYEMILNYKSYYTQFNFINEQIKELLISSSNFQNKVIYFDILSDTVMLVIISILIYIYLLKFENILIKIINYLNMVMNSKNDGFNFNEIFSKKIENLQIILTFYKENPLKAIKNLRNIYNNYQQYLTTKNNNSNNINKKNNKKIIDKENEIDDIPKNQRILTNNNIRKLNITFKYLVFISLFFLFIIILFTVLIILWEKIITAKTNLYILIDKNFSLETSIYTAINLYDLMIFNNYTIKELEKNYLNNNVKNEENVLFK